MCRARFLLSGRRGFEPESVELGFSCAKSKDLVVCARNWPPFARNRPLWTPRAVKGFVLDLSDLVFCYKPERASSEGCTKSTAMDVLEIHSPQFCARKACFSARGVHGPRFFALRPSSLPQSPSFSAGLLPCGVGGFALAVRGCRSLHSPCFRELSIDSESAHWVMRFWYDQMSLS